MYLIFYSKNLTFKNFRGNNFTKHINVMGWHDDQAKIYNDNYSLCLTFLSRRWKIISEKFLYRRRISNGFINFTAKWTYKDCNN